MRIVKLIALSLAMMLSLNGVASAESTLNKILSSGVLKAGTTGDFHLLVSVILQRMNMRVLISMF